MHKIIYFFQKKICVPTLPKIFRPVTPNTHTFLFGLSTTTHVYEKLVCLFKARHHNKHMYTLYTHVTQATIKRQYISLTINNNTQT